MPTASASSRGARAYGGRLPHVLRRALRKRCAFARSRGARRLSLNGLLPGIGPAYAARHPPGARLSQEIEEWAAFCRGRGLRLPAALHVDTGINRLGFWSLTRLARRGRALRDEFEPALLMSHFASSEDVERPLNPRQIAAFAKIRAALPGIPASLSNSSGIFWRERLFHDLVRPGYALYGGNPTPDAPNPMRPVVGLKRASCRCATCAPARRPATTRAGRLRAAPRRRTLDRLCRRLLPRREPHRCQGRHGAPAGAALVAGRLCPFVGRVSMDLIIVDVTRCRRRRSGAATLATLIGDAIDRRRGRSPRRHHRLRRPDGARAALRTDLPGRLTDACKAH